MSTDTTTEATSKSSATPAAPPITAQPEPGQQLPPDQGGPQPTPADAEAQKMREEHEDALEVLEPSKVLPRKWTIGKGPEHGGTEDEYSIYVQRTLDYMPRLRFFSLVATAVSDAIKQGGSITFGGSDLFSGNLRERARDLTMDDFGDAASFMSLALQLIAYTPDFMIQCYLLWLDVPQAEQRWAKIVMNQPFDPERKKWGLTDEQHLELVETFIDQNYDEIREFFTGKLPRLATKVREREAARQARESESAQSKQ